MNISYLIQSFVTNFEITSIQYAISHFAPIRVFTTLHVYTSSTSIYPACGRYNLFKFLAPISAMSFEFNFNSSNHQLHGLVHGLPCAERSCKASLVAVSLVVSQKEIVFSPIKQFGCIIFLLNEYTSENSWACKTIFC